MATVTASFGDELRSERESRGISLETLCAQTKVSSRYLQSLEQGNYKALPGGIFRRGIVRAYLHSIGLEEQAWMARFEQSFTAETGMASDAGAADEQGWASFAANVKRNRTTYRRSNLGRWLGVFALFLVLAAVGASVWFYVLKPRLHDDSFAAPAPKAQGSLLAPRTGSQL